jgi:hypothetical protein
MASMYISEWDLHGAAPRLLLPACATREKYTPRDMAFLHVYIRMGSAIAALRLLPAASRKGEYTPRDMAFLHVYTSEWDLHGAATSYHQQLVPSRENIRGTWHSSMYISERTTRCSAADYYQQPCAASRRNTPRTWHSSMYITEWDLHGCHSATTSSLREIYTQDMVTSMYIRMDLYLSRQEGYYQQLQPQGRNIHPDMAFLHVYVTGIYTMPPLFLTLVTGLILRLACD